MFCLYTLHSGIKASGMNLQDWKLWFGGCWLFGFAYDLMGPGFLRPPECFDYDYLGAKSCVWMSFDTGSPSSRMSFIPLLGLKQDSRDGRRGEGCGEELTGLRQTQRMAAAVDPRCPPTLQHEHMLELTALKKKERERGTLWFALRITFPNVGT